VLQRFRQHYIAYTALFSGVIILALAWRWSQPTGDALGFSYSRSLPILLVASVVVNGISFFFQDRYVRGLLRRPEIAAQFSTVRYALRFYLYNLIVAVALCIVLYLPLLYLIFFYVSYPIALWLIPYHLITGFLLGREIERVLRMQPGAAGSVEA
jgi:hypothetical protein